jgi:hypothetical protein
MDFHLESRIRDNLKSGMSRQEAERDACRRFGNRTLAKERTREMDIFVWVENLGQDLRYALRSLCKSPGFTAVAVLALMLGIGANTAVFTVVNGVLLRPLPFPQADRLAAISYKPQHGPFETGPSISDGHFLAFRRQNRSFERITTFSGYPMSLTGAGDPVRLPSAAVTPDFFPVIGVGAAIGRTFLAEEDQKGRDEVAVLSDKLWRSRFGGDANVLGRTITVEGVARKIIGVIRAASAILRMPPCGHRWRSVTTPATHSCARQRDGSNSACPGSRRRRNWRRSSVDCHRRAVRTAGKWRRRFSR